MTSIVLEKRLVEFDDVLFSSSKPRLDLQQLSSLCFRGIPEVPGLRALCWQLLLGYLPRERSRWTQVLGEHRRSYYEVMSDIASTEESARLAAQIRVDVDRTMPDIALFHNSMDNPADNTSRCGTNISDRTAVSSSESLDGMPRGSIYRSDSVQSSLTWQVEHLKKSLGGKVANVMGSATVSGNTDGSGWLGRSAASHEEAMARILYVHAKFNRGAGYAQGMNEILAPLYYVLAGSQQKVSGYSHADCEADAFHLFILALRGVHLDMFITAMDSTLAAPKTEEARPQKVQHGDVLAAALMAGSAVSYVAAMHSAQSTAMRSLPRPTSPEVPMLLTGGTGGLQHTLKYWWFSCVRAADRQLWAKLEGLGIQPEHFALRWLLVWGAREFALPDVLLLWDALMSNRARLTAAQQQPEADQSQSDDSRLEAEFLLDREVTRALQPACEGTEELIHPEQFRSVNFSAGRLDCNVRVQQSASGDDEDCSELGFLFDFFTAVLLAVRGRLLSMDFEQCIGFLQCLPRHIEELDMPQLLAETTRIRQRRAVARVVHACRSVLASAAPRKRSDSQAAKLAPLVNSLATTTTLASPEPQSPDPLIMVSKFFGQITGKLKFLQPGSAPTSPVSPLSPPPSATWDGTQAPAYLLLALARASAKGARQLHIYEVVDYSAATNTAAVRKMAECDAAAPSLVGIERQANRIDRTIVKVCLTPPEVAPMVSSVGKQAGELLAGPGSFSGSRSGGGSAAKLQHGRQGLPSLTIPKPAAGVRAASSSSTVVGDKEPFWWASMETEPRALGRTRIDFELCDFDSDDDE